MKKPILLILGLWFGVAVAGAQDDCADPGRVQGFGSITSVELDDTGGTNYQPGFGGGAQPQGQPPSPTLAEAITPEVSALARGLQNDPTRIFNYVHDHIRYVFYFGSKKGAALTLLEQSGNDFDQCALLSALLTSAGYSPGYQFGLMEIPYDASGDNDLHHWLGLSLLNTNWANTYNYFGYLLGTRGYPVLLNLGDNNTLLLQRVWVTLAIGGTNYYLDPSFKISEPVAGINLASAMGLNTNSFLSSAGGTNTADYVQDLNEGNVRSNLTFYTTSLLGYIQSNCPNATVQQVIGGQQIVSSAGLPLSTSLTFPTYTNSSYSILAWSVQPTNFMSAFSISFAGTNQSWYTPQLQGQRVSLTFSNSGLAQLYLEDFLVLQTTNTGSGGTVSVTLSATHPYGSWDTTHNVPIDGGAFDRSFTRTYQRTNANYAIMYAFEPGTQWLQARQQKLDMYRQQGLADTSRQVVNETLNVMGLNWMVQTELNEELLAQQWGQLPQEHHRFGRMAQESGKGYYVDVYLQLSGTFPNTGANAGDFQNQNQVFDVSSYFWSGMEHGIIEQMQSSNLVAASTVKMLEIASTNSEKIYLATSANWTSGANVRGNLVGYNSSVLSNLDGLITSNLLLLPKNGTNHVAGSGSWRGDAYVELGTNSGGRLMGMIIGGGYNGGYVSDPGSTVDPVYVSSSSSDQPTYISPAPVSVPSVTSADPVNMPDCTFQIDASDLALGQREPRGISLERHYGTAYRFQNVGGMSYGWLHNYCIKAEPTSAPQASLGQTTPQQMAPMLAASCAALNLYNNTAPDPKNWTVTALIAKWAIDQMTSNAVSVVMGEDTIQFVKQPDGTFTPPANNTMTLTNTGGHYALQERHGRRFNFNSGHLLTNIVDQYNQALNLTYNSSNWVSTIKDWKNRTLTFTYSGSPSRLASVSDGTRSVSYGYSTTYNSQGDLTSFTDAGGKTSTFAYDTNHQIIATSNALGQLVVTNIYDSFGRVMTQYTMGSISRTWQIYWSGFDNITVDPLGGQEEYLYDGKSRQIGFVDALSNFSQTFYDGQDHAVMTVSPLFETNQLIYDANNNLVQTVDPLGFTNSFVYDSQNNLVETIDALGNSNSFGYNTEFSLTGSTNGAGDFLNYSYNTDGTLAGKTDPGGTTTFGYDSLGQLNVVTFPGTLGSEGFLNSTFGDVLSHTNTRGFITSFTYNNRRQLTGTTAPTNLTTSITYDAVGNVATTVDARSFTTSNFWSATRKLLGTAFPATLQGTPAVTNFYDSRDWLAETLNPLQQPTIYTNDLAHRLIGLADGLLRTNTFGYDNDNRRTSAANAASETTHQQWSSRGDLLLFTDQASKSIGYSNDATGNQIFLTNRNGKRWQFHYDKANRLTNTVTPLGRTSVEVFNNRGLLQAITNSLGNATTFGYDARGRLTSRTDLVATTTFVYDPNGNLATNSENGQSLIRTFDAYDRLSTYTDAGGNEIQYRYDANGNLTSLIYPGPRTVTYAYDSLNRLTNVTDWASRQTSFTYDLASRLASITRPNGTVRSNYYDAAGELTNIVEQAASHAPIAFFKLSFNPAARVQWEFGAPLPHTYTPATRTMTYDDDNRLQTFNSLNVSNDFDGNMTSGPLTNDTLSAYGYDARNRLLSVGGLDYAYDPGNNRVAVTNDANVTQFVISPNGSQVLMRTKGSLTSYYVYGPGLLYEVDETASATNTATYHYDCRGSTVALTDGGGNVTDRIEYSAYGMVTYRAGSTDTPFLFNGQYGVQTDANGLLYMRARYYNPYICRFINADPSGFSAGMNFYAYADGNPISLIDPFGLGAQEGWGGATATWIQNNFVNPLNSIGTESTYANFSIYTLASVANGFADLLRLGQGTANATYNAQDGWDVAIGITQDVQRAAGVTVITGGALTGLVGDGAPPPDNAPASTPVGRSGQPMSVSTSGGTPSNSPTTVNGVDYSGHALDSMQSDGITPSVVQNTVTTGTSIPGKVPGTTAYYDPVNNITVVTDTTSGRVVTVSRGQIRQ